MHAFSTTKLYSLAAASLLFFPESSLVSANAGPGLVFATDETFLATAIGGLSGADAKCQAEAELAGLSGTFTAWLSDSTADAKDRIGNNDEGYIRPDGTVVARNLADIIDGSVLNFINQNAKGTFLRGHAWTGTDADGGVAGIPNQFYETCNDWTGDASESNGRFGSLTDERFDRFWTSRARHTCGRRKRLYCFQTGVSVETSSAPTTAPTTAPTLVPTLQPTVPPTRSPTTAPALSPMIDCVLATPTTFVEVMLDAGVEKVCVQSGSKIFLQDTLDLSDQTKTVSCLGGEDCVIDGSSLDPSKIGIISNSSLSVTLEFQGVVFEQFLSASKDTPTIRLLGEQVVATFRSCRFRNNQGGAVGIVNIDSVTFENCGFYENTNFLGDGGAVSVVRTDFLAETTVFEGNSADDGGAVLLIQDSEATRFVDCTIDNNSASDGGALYIESGGLTEVIDCSMTTNVASGEGGAMYLVGDEALAENSLKIHNLVCDGNESIEYWGGCMYIEELGGGASITSSTFSGNRSPSWGGAISTDEVFGFFLIQDCTFEGNVGFGDEEVFGGGVSFYDVEAPSVINSTFVENSAQFGGAISVEKNGHFPSADAPLEVEIVDCTFERNVASLEGGAIYLFHEGRLSQVRDEDFNRITTEIAQAPDCLVALRGMACNDNEAQLGGCIYIEDVHKIVDISAFEANQPEIEMTDCSFDGNVATVFDAGAHIDTFGNIACSPNESGLLPSELLGDTLGSISSVSFSNPDAASGVLVRGDEVGCLL